LRLALYGGAALCAVACIGLAVWAWRRAQRQRRRLVQLIESIAPDYQRDVLIPDGLDGWYHVDFLLRTSIGLVILDVRDVRGAVFGGEHSGHFYFGNFWRADSGMLAALFALSELAASDLPLSELLAPYSRYFSSGEINTRVENTADPLEFIKASFELDYPVDDLDGYTITGPDWWFNVRGSNTEPLLRLNVEAHSVDQMKRVRDQVLALIR